MGGQLSPFVASFESKSNMITSQRSPGTKIQILGHRTGHIFMFSSVGHTSNGTVFDKLQPIGDDNTEQFIVGGESKMPPGKVHHAWVNLYNVH